MYRDKKAPEFPLVLSGCAGIDAAHAEVGHPDGKRALDVAQIVALGGSGKGGSDAAAQCELDAARKDG